MPVNDQQVTNKMHAVPQNIMDVEFKIIGDLTMRQFFYLLIFSALAYASFALIGIAIFKWVLGLSFVGLGIVLAFLPIEDRGLDEWITNFFRGVYLPNQRVWRKEPIPLTAFSYQNINVVKQELITLTPTTSRRQLEDYLESYTVTKVVDPLDIKEEEFIRKVHDAYVLAPVMTAPPIQVAPPIQIEQEVPQNTQVSQKPEKQEEEKESTPIETKPQTENMQKPVQNEKQTETKQKEDPVVTKHKEDKKKDRFKINLPASRHGEQKTLLPISPDRHAGRKFTSLLPNQGEIVLPIRGEKVLKTKEIVEAEEDLKDKADQLQKLLQQIKTDETIMTPAQSKVIPQNTEETPKEEEISKKAEQVVKEIEGEREQIDQEISKLKTEIDTEAQPQERTIKEKLLQSLLQKRTQKGADYDKLKQQVAELQEQLANKNSTQNNAQVEKMTVDPTFAQIQPLTNEPNIISGLVKTPEGVALPGVVAIVKNQTGEPVRAIKTNSLGQFKITTSLVNGVYTIEIDKSNKTGLTFDIINISADGKVIPPIEFVGKK